MAWRTDPDAALIADLASDSTTGPLIAGSAPDGRIRGTVKERYFFRRAAGNGWTLVGDAGHHKEFVIGDGITEALLQARSLAAAIAQGTRRRAASLVAGSGRRGAAVLLPRAGRRGARASHGASASRLFACGEDALASGADGGHDGAPALAARDVLCSTSACGGRSGRPSGDRCASYQSSSRWAGVGQPSTASCVCVNGFSLRRRRPRRKPSRLAIRLEGTDLLRCTHDGFERRTRRQAPRQNPAATIVVRMNHGSDIRCGSTTMRQRCTRVRSPKMMPAAMT